MLKPRNPCIQSSEILNHQLDQNNSGFGTLTKLEFNSKFVAACTNKDLLTGVKCNFLLELRRHHNHNQPRLVQGCGAGSRDEERGQQLTRLYTTATRAAVAETIGLSKP